MKFSLRNFIEAIQKSSYLNINTFNDSYKNQNYGTKLDNFGLYRHHNFNRNDLNFYTKNKDRKQYEKDLNRLSNLFEDESEVNNGDKF